MFPFVYSVKDSQIQQDRALTGRGASSMKVKNCVLGVIVFSVSLIASQMVYASDAVLKNLSFASLPGGRFEVRMEFDGTPPEPAGYEIDKPARIVLDFAGVDNALETKKFPLPFDNAKSAVVLGSDDRTRLILNMARLDLYETRVEGNSFFIEVGSNKVEDVLKQSTTIVDKVTSDINEYEAAITNIDFRRGESGEGKILIDLSDPAVNINVDQSGNEIKLTFLDTQLPVNLRRRLDVTDFATPVLFVSSDFDGRNTMVTIKPEGDYDYLAYQTGQEYVVSVKELTAQELEERKAKFTFVGEKLSLNFQDIPVRSVLQIIADFTELNLVASDTVDGTITLRLDNVPWDQALELVLKTKGLDKRQVGNVLMVAPATEIAEQERQQLETMKQLEELAPLKTEFIQVLYGDADDIAEMFGEEEVGILSERGSYTVDTRTNSILLTETQGKIDQFRELIATIDVPVRQVSVEARIVRAGTDFSKSLGVRWGFFGNESDVYGSGGTNTLLSDYNADTENAFNIEVGNDPEFREVEYIGDGADGLVSDLAATTRGSDPARITLGLVHDTGLLTMELSAIQSKGQAELVSQPKVITQDKQKAVIKSGEEIPYAQSTSSGATAIAFREAVLKLEVTPYITPDDRIFLDLVVEQANRSNDTSVGIPIIETTEVETNLLVNNGETVVLGGIYEDTAGSTTDKVPFFGDLPMVGRFFRRTSEFVEKSELLIFLTPRILNDPLQN